jgi:SAM-dependent methyltransferase
MGEFVMVRKHPEFAPFFLRRVLRAKEARHGVRRASPWPWLVDRVPAGTNRLRRRAEERADAWYYDRLGEAFFEGWAAAEDLADLQAYLGTAFDWSLLRGHHAAVEAERLQSPDEESFYRSSQAYLYDLTAFAMTSTKAPYLTDLRRFLTPGARVLDYGCGIGADGLRLIRGGADVSFADFDNPSTAFLRWRLERRGLHSPVYDIDDHVPGGFDAAFSFDVIEHVDEPLAFLAALEERAGIVAVNFLEPDPDDTDLHRPLPVPELLDHADDLGILRYRRYHRRSHLVIYRSPLGPSVSALASHIQRRLGRVLPGSPNWSPVPQP